MPEHPPKPKFQFSICTLLLVTVLIAIVCSSYRAGGLVALMANLKYGTLVGLVFVLLTWKGLGWNSLFIFSGAIVGAVISIDIEVYRVSQMVQGLKYADLVNMVQWEGLALLGAFVGGITSVGIAKTVLLWRQCRTARKLAEGDQSCKKT
jgi:hypothetical protein